MATEELQAVQSTYMAYYNVIWSLIFGLVLMVLLIAVLLWNIKQRQIAQARLYRQNEYLELMHRTALSLMNRLDSEDLLEAIVKRAGQFIGTEHGFVYLVSDDETYLELRVASGIMRSSIGRRLEPGQGVAGRVWNSGESFLVSDYANWEGRLNDAVFDSASSVVGIPLKSMGRVAGVVGLVHIGEDKKFGQEQLFFLGRFAELASLAVDNARLYHEACQELAERKKIDKALRRGEAKLRTILSAIPDQIVRFSRSGLFLEVITAQDCVPTRPAKEMIGLSIEDIYPPEIALLYRRGINTLLTTGNTQVFEYHLQTGAVATDCEARLVASAENEILAIVRDVTERKKMEAQLQYLSLHDSLTGLYNRAYFQQEMRRLASGRQLPVGVVVCDVDGLKLINDTLGHEHGDTLIITVSRILTECFRSSDVVARIGGDEFAILLPEISRPALDKICRRIQTREADYNRMNLGIPLGLSVGYAISDGAFVNMNTLFQEADNAMYRHKLLAGRDTKSVIVQGMLKALESRDFFDHNHAVRLRHFVGMIGEKLQLPKRRLHDLSLLAQFHDIGKVGVPDSIIYKPDRLTEEEFAEIRRHCEIGYRIVRSIPDLVGIADWVLKHHESWDGLGYPLGLKGEEIPLESRILAVADAYEVMTAERPYRKALTKEQAIVELKQQAGIQFDPSLVELFVELVTDAHL